MIDRHTTKPQMREEKEGIGGGRRKREQEEGGGRKDGREGNKVTFSK